jgi:Na+/melibiose symporter-like transporter
VTDFQRLWLGQGISVFGSLITRTALPWTALLVLHAGPRQMALLALCDLVPGVLLGLAAGAWVDRLRRRPVLVATDLARMALVLSLPLLSALGGLSLPLLAVLALLTGALTTVFEIAYAAYLPTLVTRDALVRANSRLSATASVAEILAFGCAGWLVALFGGPNALLIDAATFLVSAISLAAIRTPEPQPQGHAPVETPDLRREIVAGLRFVRAQAVLRPLLLGEAALALSSGLMGALYLLFATRTLGFSPGPLGMVFAIGGATSLGGAALAPRLGTRLGAGRAALAGLLCIGLGSVATALAPARSPLGLGMLVVTQLVSDPGWTIYEIHLTALRQALTPDALLGRVGSLFRVANLALRLAATVFVAAMGDALSPRIAVGTTAMLVVGTAGALWLSPLVRADAPLTDD